ncbi:MAG: lamin tail domain-containing protein, partial [Phycisphaerae bacterium]|nr:lamin tail domain-containing protein [Phycisphaerae bacterium]
EYNPATGNQDEEYIQLINPQSIAVDISDWKIANAITHTFPAGTVIPAGGSLYLTPNALSFRARTTSPKGGEQLFVQGNYSGHLSSWGGTIDLFNAQRVLVTSNTYAGSPSDAQRYLRISELMYHPQDPATGSGFDAEAFEYLELANIGDHPLSLTGMQLTNGVLFAFPDGAALPAQSYLLVVKNFEALASRYTIPAGVQVFGPYAGGLANSGETLKLEDATHSTIVEFKYDDDWYPLTDGDGFSLTAADLAGTAHNDWDRRTAWRASTFKGGTPGFDDVGPAPNSVVINELLAHSHDPNPQNPESDWIELKNTTDEDINISGWFLSDNNDDDPNCTKYEFPDGTIIPRNGFWLLNQSESFGNDDAPGCKVPFALSEGGETLYLFSGQDGALTGAYSTQQKFAASATGITLGRYEKASLTNGYDFVPMKTPTPGDDNSEPLVGPVVISEIMYNPASTDTGGEYIEIRNTGTTAVELMSWVTIQQSDDPVDLVTEYQPWRITGEVEFTFPANRTIPAGGFLIVAQNPTAFKAKYPAVPAARVLGPYEGKLNNGGGNILLTQPGDHEWGKDQYLIPRDKVEYDDETPWPVAPDGGGPSLNRIVPSLYGNDPANWQAAAANPNS